MGVLIEGSKVRVERVAHGEAGFAAFLGAEHREVASEGGPFGVDAIPEEDGGLAALLGSRKAGAVLHEDPDVGQEVSLPLVGGGVAEGS